MRAAYPGSGDTSNLRDAPGRRSHRLQPPAGPWAGADKAGP